MSVRNYEEYRAEVLEGLGATTEDIRNEASWRAKVLEALGAEYTDEDTRNFERYRLKVLENLSGGGGGSSDFSTAEVTIIASANFGFDSGLTIFDNTFGIYAIGGANEGTEIIDVPLYKGHCTWFQDPTAIVLSGNAQVVTDEEGNHIDITGDCTITIS